MSWFTNFKKKLELRNLASSVVLRPSQTPKPVYTNWSLKKAVKEGYEANSWVYRSIYLKMKAAGSVEWHVKNDEGEIIESHPLNALFRQPNPHMSRQDFMELIVSWMELAGNSYLKKAGASGKTLELWPISPDRLHPIPTTDVEKWIEGYALDKSKTKTYEPEEIIHHKYLNPANPIIGISPLQVLGKTIDLDNSQRDFNAATSMNRGVIDGVFIFKRHFESQAATDVVRDSLNERHKGKRTFGVLGDEAKYVRTALTPAEMDFIASRKSNREEIFICLGVPPVYAGVMDGATMNNYKTSELVFWFGTMLFLLDNLKDTFNFTLGDELGKGATIEYDISNIPAIREALLSKTKTAKSLFEMGVPFEQLNKVFKFGFSEYPGWEDSNVANTANAATIKTDSETRSSNGPKEFRVSAEDTQEAVEKEADKNSSIFEKLLQNDQEAVFDALNNSIDADIEKVLAGTRSLWLQDLAKVYTDTGVKFGLDLDSEQRASTTQISAAVNQYLIEESIILNEVSFIQATTVDKIITQVRSAAETGASMTELQQAVIDTGIFNEKRALSLARTLSGTAANLGQWKTAELNGADMKTWSTALFEVRKTHQALEGVTVGIDETFNVGGYPAKFPLDNNLPPKERVN